MNNRQKEILDIIQHNTEIIEENDNKLNTLKYDNENIKVNIDKLNNKKIKQKKNISDKELDTFFDERGF